MRRRLNEKEDAVTHVIEFTIALTVFVLVLQAFTSSMNFRIGIDLDNNDNRVVMAREVMSELAGSEGKIDNSTEWEKWEFGSGELQLKNGVTVGILNSNGEIDKDKCDALKKFPNTDLRSELDIEEQLRIEVRTLVPNEIVCEWGNTADNAPMSVKNEKYLLYNDGTNAIPSVLTVTIHSGQPPTTNLYMTEVMYNPVTSSSNYEWIEIYNPNNVAVYLNSWKISDITEEDSIVPEGSEEITLPAKGVGILTTSKTVFRDTYGNHEYVFLVEDTAIGNGLSNSDNLTLSKQSFEDTFSYTKDMGADGNGKTLTRSCYNCETWTEANESAGTYSKA